MKHSFQFFHQVCKIVLGLLCWRHFYLILLPLQYIGLFHKILVPLCLWVLGKRQSNDSFPLDTVGCAFTYISGLLWDHFSFNSSTFLHSFSAVNDRSCIFTFGQNYLAYQGMRQGHKTAGAHSTRSLKIIGCKRRCPKDLLICAPAALVLTHSLSHSEL